MHSLKLRRLDLVHEQHSTKQFCYFSCYSYNLQFKLELEILFYGIFFSNENIRLILSIRKWSFSCFQSLHYWIIRKFMQEDPECNSTQYSNWSKMKTSPKILLRFNGLICLRFVCIFYQFNHLLWQIMELFPDSKNFNRSLRLILSYSILFI